MFSSKDDHYTYKLPNEIYLHFRRDGTLLFLGVWHEL